jgi:hypothetical protein
MGGLRAALSAGLAWIVGFPHRKQQAGVEQITNGITEYKHLPVAGGMDFAMQVIRSGTRGLRGLRVRSHLAFLKSVTINLIAAYVQVTGTMGGLIGKTKFKST